MADITFDFQRRERIGLSEAVLCAGKSAAQIGEAIALAKGRKTSLLLTRLTPEMVSELTPAELGALDYDPHSRTAILGKVPEPGGEPPVAVVTAGTSDLPVAREAIRTLVFYGVAAREIADVGVAGLWRILRHEEELRRYPVVIVVAGMEGALPSVVGGLTSRPVIAVPTSVGYGASFEGLAALLAMLNSCAAGLAVVNIDNGFGAGHLACTILRSAARIAQRGSEATQADDETAAEKTRR
jgi:pyridinium-3,5-biscarboxylic acid mononucleotide synthase